MGTEPNAPASPATLAEALAVALDPFGRISLVFFITRFVPRATPDPDALCPWLDVHFVGGTPADHAAARLVLQDHPDVWTPPAWWATHGWPPEGRPVAAAPVAPAR